MSICHNFCLGTELVNFKKTKLVKRKNKYYEQNYWN